MKAKDKTTIKTAEIKFSTTAAKYMWIDYRRYEDILNEEKV
jgi:hypothetical protein